MKYYAGNNGVKLLKSMMGPEFDNNVYLHKFPSGEEYCQYKESLRGEDIFIIQSTSSPANDSLMQLLVMVDAARRASAGTITAVIPYMGYSRQERKEKSRVPISAKLVMDLLEASGVNRIVAMDLHTPQIGGFTNLPLDHLTFQPILCDYITNKYCETNDIVVVSPDVGAVKRGEQLAERLKCDFGFISKKRTGDSTVELNHFVGDVTNKTAIIFDDLTESCGTLVQAANACKENGAKKVVCAVTHFCITDIGMSRLIENMPHPNINGTPSIDEFIHSDTVDVWWNKKYKPNNIVELSVSDLILKACNNIHENKSLATFF